MATNNASTSTSSASTANAQSVTSPQANVPMAGFALWVAGWVLFIVVIYLLSRSRAGQSIVYYILWIMIAFTLVTHADAITTIFQQADIKQGQY